MASFTSVPFEDISYVLSSNGIVVPSDKTYAYQLVWEIIKEGLVQNVPITIGDWSIAYNLGSNGINIPRITTSQILFTPDNELSQLANTLTLNIVDKERIIRILGYLDVLDNDMSIYDTLPEHVLSLILQKLECADILLTCKISKTFNKVCNEDKITTILRKKLEEKTGLVLPENNQEQLSNMCKYTRQLNIYASFQHGFYLKDGNVYGFGEGAFDQIGKSNDTLIKLIPGLNKIIQLGIGGFHTLALTSDEQVYSFGMNDDGQLGIGNNDDRYIPILIEGIYNVVQTAAGNAHSLLLTGNGQVYSFGENISGQLGIGNNNNVKIPTLISLIDNVVQISARENHSLLLTNNGHVYSFGDNALGQLGIGNDNDNANIPTLIPELNRIVSVSAGSNFSLILNEYGQVYSVGSNAYGQLGIGTDDDSNVPILIPELNDIVQISAGGTHSLVLNKYGQVYGFGDNGEGQLGLGDNKNRYLPTLIGVIHNAIQIAAGGLFSLILNQKGEIYYFGQLTNEIYETTIPTLFAKI
jgi:alpha-tubulin suppressor-like RCC1 family protein